MPTSKKRLRSPTLTPRQPVKLRACNLGHASTIVNKPSAVEIFIMQINIDNGRCATETESHTREFGLHYLQHFQRAASRYPRSCIVIYASLVEIKRLYTARWRVHPICYESYKVRRAEVCYTAKVQHLWNGIPFGIPLIPSNDSWKVER